jgi:hypothetical protein
MKNLMLFAVLPILLLQGCSEEDSQASDKKKFVKEAVDYLNKSTPLEINEITTLEKAKIGSKGEIIYVNSLSAFKSELDVESYRTTLENNIRAYWCDDERAAAYRERNIDAVYQYRDADGQKILTIEMDISTCNGEPEA